MDFKAFPFELAEVKAGNDGWEFTGYVATTSNVDHGNDVVMPGAFDRTLKERDYRPLLWAHQANQPPIGVERSLKVDAKGLLGTWSLLDTQLGSDVYKGLKAGALRRMSMGYQAVDVEYDDQIRKLLDVELIESSVVPIPMNDQADITNVKAALSVTRKYMGDMGMQGYVPGSFEERQDALREAVNQKYAAMKGTYACILATFSDRVVICVTSMPQGDMMQAPSMAYFEVQYTMDGDAVTLGAEQAVSVEQVTTVSPKSLLVLPISRGFVEGLADTATKTAGVEASGQSSFNSRLELMRRRLARAGILEPVL